MSSESVLWVGAMASAVTAVGAFGSTWLSSKLAHKNERKRTVEAANRDKLSTLTYGLLETTAKLEQALSAMSLAADRLAWEDIVDPNAPALDLCTAHVNELKTQIILLRIYAPNSVLHATNRVLRSAEKFMKEHSKQTHSKFWADRSSELLFDYEGHHEVLISEVRKALHVDRSISTVRRIARFARACVVKLIP